MNVKTYYIGCFKKTSDSTAIFEVRWIGSHYEKAIYLLSTVFKRHLLLDDHLLHYLLVDDDVVMDWSRVKDIKDNA